jgi:hypothetical protein
MGSIYSTLPGKNYPPDHKCAHARIVNCAAAANFRHLRGGSIGPVPRARRCQQCIATQRGNRHAVIVSVAPKPADCRVGRHSGQALSETAAPPGASVYTISPKDGDTVSSPFKIQFGLTGMGVAPAGVEKPKTGHHHLIIDATLSAEELKQPIAGDAKHVHFGGGQTETMVTLPPGQHTLQLVLGDWSHVPFDPPIMSPVVTVTVK